MTGLSKGIGGLDYTKDRGFPRVLERHKKSINVTSNDI
jgi:hypothetical protein